MRGTVLVLCLAALLGVDLAQAGPVDPLPGRIHPVGLPTRSLLRPPSQIPVGTWVEYSLWDRLQRSRIRIRFALVGRTRRGYWWEVSFRKARTPPLHLKVLSRGTLGQPKQILRVIVQTGRSQPLELPLEQGQRIVARYVQPNRGARVQHLGSARLTTPAGTFSAKHRRWTGPASEVFEEWTSQQVRLFGLVRFRSRRFDMVVIGQGNQARSRIRGTPMRWHLPGL